MMSESLRVYCYDSIRCHSVCYAVRKTTCASASVVHCALCIARVSRQSAVGSRESAPVTVAWRRDMSHVMTVRLS